VQSPSLEQTEVRKASVYVVVHLSDVRWVIRQAFERDVFKASTRQPAEGEANIFMCKGLIVLYRSQDDCTFYVVGAEDENEVILVSLRLNLPAILGAALSGLI
jgi:hypothetical protein